MARAGTPLDIGDPFPPLAFETLAPTSQARLELSEAFDGRWGVLLLYRAHW